MPSCAAVAPGSDGRSAQPRTPPVPTPCTEQTCVDMKVSKQVLMANYNTQYASIYLQHHHLLTTGASARALRHPASCCSEAPTWGGRGTLCTAPVPTGPTGLTALPPRASDLSKPCGGSEALLCLIVRTVVMMQLIV